MKLNASAWIAAVAAALCSSVSWAAVVHRDVDELAVQADRIVIGDVVRIESDWNDDHTLIMSRVVIQVSDVLKGRAGDTLSLELFGGTVDDVTLFTNVTPMFLEGDHVLLFLEGPGNDLAGSFQGAYLTDGQLTAQMHGGFQRFQEETIRPFEDLLDEIRRALPEGLVPKGVRPYDGDFVLVADDFVLLQCNWSYMLNPMGETYRINPNCTDGGCGTDDQVINALNQGAVVWDNAGADYYFNYAGTTASQFQGFDGQNIIFFQQSNILGPNPIAVTFFFCSGGNMTEWDIVFNDFYYNFWDGVTGPCIGQMDIQGVSAHELGHGLGLGHSPVNGSTMFASTGPCGTGVRTLHPDDINGIEFIYGVQLSALPFSDSFPSTVIDGTKWIGIDGVTANARGINEPSEPYSLDLDGAADGGNQILSSFMDLTGMSDLKLQYYYQRTGNVDSPEAGDDLFVEYPTSAGFWVELNRHLGSGPDMTEYELVTLNLPAPAYHDDFRVRFRANSAESNDDDWFVDNVFVGEVTACPWDLDGSGSVGISDLLDLLAAWGTDPGGPPDFNGDGTVGISDLLELLANWGNCP
jgi:hypothetical protein